jgi:FKBP-type peptidyl-prolyl cis-trans isomerase FkpA
MKKPFLVFVIIFSVIFYYSCTKSTPDTSGCTPVPVTTDSAALIRFAGDTIPLTWDSSGLYYHIVDSGNSLHPVNSSTITVNYVGRLMDNTIFDSASNTNLQGHGLYDLILGWRFGLPKIGVGGRILLFIPSAFAWGCTGYGPVGPNQPVFFDVKLLAVN